MVRRKQAGKCRYGQFSRYERTQARFRYLHGLITKEEYEPAYLPLSEAIEQSGI